MSETTETSGTRYLDPAALARLKNLGLVARLVVEGLFTGRHHSPHRGFSIEFAEHREYTPGIDPRHLDWKVLGKRDKLYIKQYEEQTNLRGYLLLDTSRSMHYQHGSAITKLEYASYCAASLAYLMQAQHDAFGLITFADKALTHIPPRQGKAHLRVIMDTLEHTEAGGQTDLAATFHDLAERINRRALIVVLSDLFSGEGDNGTQELIDAIGHFRHRKHEVVVLQILDPAELRFPFSDTGRIEDMESGRVIEADADAIRHHYLDRLQAFIDTVRHGCVTRDIGYALGDTSEPFDTFLGTYLSTRQRRTIGP